MSKRTYRNIACSTAAIAIATVGAVMMMAGCARTADYTGDDTASPAAVEAATADDAETAATEAIGADGTETAATEAATLDAAEAGGAIGMPSPIVEYETLAEAMKAAGFEFTVPETIDGYSEISYSVISGDLIQVIYTAEDGREITIRKASADIGEDISGDYNVYDDEQVQEIDGKQVTLRGGNDKVCLAIWTDAGYSYSVMTSDGEGLGTTDAGMTVEEMSNILRTVK